MEWESQNEPQHDKTQERDLGMISLRYAPNG